MTASTAQCEPTAQHEEAICARLREATGRESYRAVARRTGAKSESVRRYLLGESTPPGWFVAAVCRTYGANANWLLLGQPPRHGTNWAEMLRSFVRDAGVGDAIAQTLIDLSPGMTIDGSTMSLDEHAARETRSATPAPTGGAIPAEAEAPVEPAAPARRGAIASGQIAEVGSRPVQSSRGCGVRVSAPAARGAPP